MFSEFTVKLIAEVKKREILYNTKYDKRPKSEKERSWEEIADNLDCSAEKCKKHWKNIRDRFVKVMHARDRHFANNGSELEAPSYIYFDMLLFMREFSVKRDLPCNNSININEIIPEPLVFAECDKLIDLTNEFLAAIKKYPILYDKNAEMRKYRGKEEWKKISDELFSRFTVGKLRSYWIVLMKKFKLYEDHRHNIFQPIRNENIFQKMTFVLSSVKVERDPVEYILEEQYQIVETDSSNNKDNYEDSLEEDDNDDDDDGEEDEFNESGNFGSAEVVIENGENETQDGDPLIEEPPVKKMRSGGLSVTVTTPQKEQKSEQQPQQNHTDTHLDDEFDFFAKKVAIQLRTLSWKNRNVARKAEIEVLQLLMEYEEHCEKD